MAESKQTAKSASLSVANSRRRDQPSSLYDRPYTMVFLTCVAQTSFKHTMVDYLSTLVFLTFVAHKSSSLSMADS